VALRAPQALVLAPTREIAVQICDVIRQIGDHVAGLTCEVFIGGLHVAQDVAKGTGCQVVVGTPGWFLFLLDILLLWTKLLQGLPSWGPGYATGLALSGTSGVVAALRAKLLPLQGHFWGESVCN